MRYVNSLHRRTSPERVNLVVHVCTLPASPCAPVSVLPQLATFKCPHVRVYVVVRPLLVRPLWYLHPVVPRPHLSAPRS